MDSGIGILGYSLARDKIPPHFMENIRNELYVKPLENPNFPTNESGYPVFRLSKTKLYIPRYYGLKEFGKPKTNNLHTGVPIDVPFVGTLRDIQQTTIDETVKKYSEWGGGLISLDTGLGKTVRRTS